MAFDKLRIYYNAIFGALGGLLSWALIGLILRFQAQSTFLLFVKDALQGALVGVCIGLALGVVDGLTVSRSLRRVARGGCLGGAIGLGGGLVGLILGEAIFLVAGGGVWPRAVGWAAFGFLLGTAEGIANRDARKASYGAVGGLLGGLIGGSTYERTSLLLRSLTHDRDLSLTMGGALGLIILGACIGSLIALTEGILRRAWLKGLKGRLEGQTLTLSKALNTLGRDERCDIRIPGDSQVAGHHADILQTPQGFVIEARGGQVLVDQQPIVRHPLHSGNRIQLGQSVLAFFAE
jgi:hypothetical protein